MYKNFKSLPESYKVLNLLDRSKRCLRLILKFFESVICGKKKNQKVSAVDKFMYSLYVHVQYQIV